AGGAAHNTGQLLVAILLVSNPRLLYYLPVLMISGILTGTLMGMISHILIRRLKKLSST
ncbi:MAG: Gx transporter family protein, partial [Lachnospiraceae bacterium]|nr:Gx transporter family protein [Lachnospiraceae bacterium]